VNVGGKLFFYHRVQPQVVIKVGKVGNARGNFFNVPQGFVDALMRYVGRFAQGIQHQNIEALQLLERGFGYRFYVGKVGKSPNPKA